MVNVLLETEQWLSPLGLQKYAQVFVDNDIGPDIIGELTDADLKELGVTLGDRKRLRNALADLQSGSGDRPAASLNDSEEAERRHLTVMFCDLVGSTALSAHYDPEDLSEIVRTYQDTCAGIVSRYEGYIAQYLGDGILVYFGYPRAHEDDAERALRTGLEIIERIQELTLRPELKLSTRIGIATGVVLVGKITGEASTKDQVVLGETPNLAARLQGLAEPNQLVIADDTHHLCGELFEYRNMGSQQIKGFSDPVTAYVVIGESASENRFAARSAHHMLPIVGRDQEIGLLLERWRQAKAGEGQLVLLSGEAGIGKSRIGRAMLDAITDDNYYRITYQCSPYHGDSTLHPAIQQLRLAAQFSTCNDDDERFAALEKVLSYAGELSAESAALLASLVGLDGEGRYGVLDLTPQQKRSRTLQALRSQLIGLADKKPTLVLLEDAHWIDPTTMEHLEVTLDAIDNKRVLIVATARPTFEHNFSGHPIVTQLTLNRLGRKHVGAIVARLTGNKTLPDALLDEITAKTDGVPLFVEELTKTILESGLLHETDTSFELRESFSSLSIPISLHDSLMARLDRLQPVKEVAQTAACIGREFDYGLLSAVSPLPQPELDMALEKLIHAELVYRRGTNVEATFQFKHALVRDAAYESLLKSKRRQIHFELLSALEKSEGAPPELLAHHASRANIDEKAINYWEQAGEAAMARPAYREAIGHLTHAIQLTEKMDDTRAWRERELKLQIQLGQAMIASYGYGAKPTVDTFQRALWLVDELGDTPLRMPALFGEWVANYVRGLPNTEHVLRFARVAEETDDNGPKVVAQRMFGLDHLHKGRFTETMTHIEKSLALYDVNQHANLRKEFGHDQRVAALNYKSWAQWYLGFPDQALATGRESLAWARELNHANSIGLGHCWGVLVPNVLVRDAQLVESEAQELFEFSVEMAMPLWHCWSSVYLGWAQVVGAGNISGLEHIEAGLEEAHDIGSGLMMPLLQSLTAESYLAADKPERAEEAIRQGFTAQKKSGDVAWSVLLYCARAKLALSPSRAQRQKAEQDLLKGLEIARSQQSRSFELRAALALAHLWQEDGDREKGRALLAPIYATFSEGFDTADLRAANDWLNSVTTPDNIK